jgi:hypothetical protein
LKLDMPVSASLVDQDHSALSEVSASRSARAALMDITARPPRGWAVVCRSVRLLARQPACVIAHGDQGGTFNGNPLMCAVGLAVMNTVLADGFLDQVRAAGDHLGERLQTLSAQYGLGAARGVGLLRALDLGQPLAATVVVFCRIVVAETPKFENSLKQLDYRLREFFDYLENNRGTTINYGKLHRAGQPISTAMAESAVNQVLNQRMCKRQQMRWTPRGAHLLAQVRCAVPSRLRPASSHCARQAPPAGECAPASPDPVCVHHSSSPINA